MPIHLWYPISMLFTVAPKIIGLHNECVNEVIKALNLKTLNEATDLTHDNSAVSPFLNVTRCFFLLFTIRRSESTNMGVLEVSINLPLLKITRDEYIEYCQAYIHSLKSKSTRGIECFRQYVEQMKQNGNLNNMLDDETTKSIINYNPVSSIKKKDYNLFQFSAIVLGVKSVSVIKQAVRPLTDTINLIQKSPTSILGDLELLVSPSNANSEMKYSDNKDTNVKLLVILNIVREALKYKFPVVIATESSLFATNLSKQFDALKIPHSYIDGKVNGGLRIVEQDKFQDGFVDVIIIAKKSGVL